MKLFKNICCERKGLIFMQMLNEEDKGILIFEYPGLLHGEI